MPIISLPVSDLSDAGGRGGGRREEGGEGGVAVFTHIFLVWIELSKLLTLILF